MTRRTERVAEAIRRIVSEIIIRELRDPRIKSGVTITKVEVTSDLKLAKIYYTTFGDTGKKGNIAAGLKSATSFMRRSIQDQLGLRYAIDLSFRVDRETEYSSRIENIITQLHNEDKDGKDERNKPGN